MALETGTYISDLVSTNPAGTDTLDKADDHLRLIKSTVKATFPNITGAVTPTHTDLNKLTSSGSPQFATIELGNASDTTISRSAAGVIAVEGGVVPKENRANTFTALQTVNLASDGDIQVLDGTTGNLTYSEYSGVSYLWNSVTPLLFGSKSATYLALGTNNSERVRVDVSGNVGIGMTPVPGPKLQANGAITTTGGLPVDLTSTGAFDFSGGNTRFISYGAAGTNGGYQWYSGQGGAGPSLRMGITANGGVSFGSSGTAYGTAGQVLKSNGDAPPTWESGSGTTLLGTITTTSGTSQSLSVTLTNYKFLKLVFNGVSHNSGSNQSLSINTVQASATLSAATLISGFAEIELTTGKGSAFLGAPGSTAAFYVLDTTVTTATTSITIAPSGGSFDAGSVLVFGVS